MSSAKETSALTEVITIPVMLDKKTFRHFAWFNTFVRQKRWVSPLIFSGILVVFAVIALATRQDQAGLLAAVLLTVGLGLPVVYFLTFLSQVNLQADRFKLDPPRKVYTVTLTREGIRVENHLQVQEPLTMAWTDTWKAFRRKDCTYLFVSRERAFLLPAGQASVPDEAMWAFLLQHMGQAKCCS